MMRGVLFGDGKKNKGFSLIELIVAVAIMVVIVGVVTPMFVQYINKSKRARDLATGERIGMLANIALISDDKAYGAWESWEKLKVKVSAEVNGVTESYNVYLVVSNESNPYNCFHGTVKEFGRSDGSTGFYWALNKEMGASTTSHNANLVPQYKVKRSGKLPGKNMDFSDVDTWRIVKRVDNGALEVWTADHNRYGGYPCFRVYPNPDDEYVK